MIVWCVFFVFFKQKTAYEMRISDWSSDVCSSDLEDRLGCLGRAPQALRLGIGLDQLDPLGVTARRLQIGDGFGIDREEAAGGAIFPRHVGDGGAVGDRQFVEARAVDLPTIADHALQNGRAACRERVWQYV